MSRELLNLAKENNDGYDSKTDVTELKDALIIIQKYEDIIKTQKKKMRLVAKQGHILKKYKDSEQIFEAVDLSKSTVYFKINLCKFIDKYHVLGRVELLSHYFKNTFRIIKVCL